MSKTFLIHGVWLVVAAGALAAGRFILPADSDETIQSAEGESLGLRAGSESRRGKTNSKSAMAQAALASDKSGLVTFSKAGGSNFTISAYLDESDPLKANAMFASILLNLTPENAKGMFEELSKGNRGGREGGQQMGLFLEAWGRLDGAAAVEAIGEMGGDGRRKAFASMSALSGWASSDPEAAIAHAASSENGWEKGMMIQGIVNGLARTDPNAATNYVLALDAERKKAAATGEGGGDDRWRGYAVDRQMETIANQQIRQGLDTATTWAEGLPAGDLKAAAFDQVAERYVRDDPAAAARWVEAHAGEDYAGRAVREIAEEFSKKDPAAAMEWAANLPDETQRGAVSETFERWTRDDPAAASTYLDKMDDSPARDSAVSSFARELDREDPSTAATWAGTIADAELRATTMESVARSWMRSNREEATAWLPTSGLTAEQQKQVVTQSQGDRGRGDFGRGRGR